MWKHSQDTFERYLYRAAPSLGCCPLLPWRYCSHVTPDSQWKQAETHPQYCKKATHFEASCKIHHTKISHYIVSGLPTLTVLLWVSRFQCKSHGLTATQTNLMGSPLCHVNIYKCYSNSASDTDFLPWWTKMWLGVRNSHRILLTVEESCMFTTLNRAYPSCASDRG